MLIESASRPAGLPVFCLDTGRLHAETYRFFETRAQALRRAIESASPDAAAAEHGARKGLFSFYEDGHEECCGIRKVEPLRRPSPARAWITGQRRDQSPTRAELPVIQDDPAFKGRGGACEVQPARRTGLGRRVAYIREPRRAVQSAARRGFVSIGCEPCTRATLPGQHERDGRWWWEEATKKECGLHKA